MKRLILDIETLPADENAPGVKENLKYLFERKLEKKERKKEISEDVVIESGKENGELAFQEYIRGTSFDGGFGRLLCVAYAVNDDAVRVICHDDEKKMLADFWFVAGQCDLFVGHNIMDFDLRFIIQRSIVLGVKISWDRLGPKRWNNPEQKYLSFAKYQHNPIYDTMYEWSNWGNSRVGTGLEHIALALGLETPKQGIDGSEVFKFYKEGKIKEICDYCARDVETTRAIYKRMTFQEKLV